MRITIALVLCLIIGAIWLKIRRRRLQSSDNSRLISFVGLVREPFSLDPTIVAHQARQAWGANLGDGSTEGPDGFVAGEGPMVVIRHGEAMFLLNSLPRPYHDDREAAAEEMADLRTRSLILEHEAWFSCDAIGVDKATPEAEVRQTVRQLAKLFAEMLDDNTLLIYLPESGWIFPNNDESEAALRGDDPIAALQATLSLPIIEVDSDHPEMIAAVETARRTWPDFVAAFNAGSGENFAVKAPVTHSGNTEFIWIEVTCLEGDRIMGRLGNDPGNLGPLKLGSNVHVPLADLNDWCYFTPEKEFKGGFTVKVLQNAAKHRPKP